MIERSWTTQTWSGVPRTTLVRNSYLKLSGQSLLYNIEDDSPYPEVRSAVANTDDPEMPVNTLRVWVLGTFFAIIIPGVNQVRSISQPILVFKDNSLIIVRFRSFSFFDILQ